MVSRSNGGADEATPIRFLPWARAHVTVNTLTQALAQMRKGRAADDAVAVSIGVVLLNSIGAGMSHVPLLHKCGAVRECMRDGLRPSAVAAMLDDLEAEAERLRERLGPV